jgi:hypothetical protein
VISSTARPSRWCTAISSQSSISPSFNSAMHLTAPCTATNRPGSTHRCLGGRWAPRAFRSPHASSPVTLPGVTSEIQSACVREKRCPAPVARELAPVGFANQALQPSSPAGRSPRTWLCTNMRA